jgi:hypothetical protein
MTAATETTTEVSRRIGIEVYEAGSRGDLPGLLSLMADDLVVEEPGFLPYGGKYHGPQGLAELVGKIGAYLDLSSVRLDYLVADGARVIGIMRVKQVGTGEDVLLAEEYTIRDGKVSRLRIFIHEAGSLTGGVQDLRTSH